MGFLFNINNNEEWRDIKGYEGLYQVSSLGRVKSLPKVFNPRGYDQIRKEKILNPGMSGKYRNYPNVKLVDADKKSKYWKVHRLVAEAFIPNPNNLPIINHKDEDPSNNKVENLEWCTYSENSKKFVDNHPEVVAKRNESHRGCKISAEGRENNRQAQLKYWSEHEHPNKGKQRKIIDGKVRYV